MTVSRDGTPILNQDSGATYGSQNRGVHISYLALTATQILVGGIILYSEAGLAWTEWDLWVSLWTSLSYIAITAAAVSICVVELGGYALILAKDLKRHLDRKWEERDEKIRQEITQEITREINDLWTGWNNRRMEAESRGEPFDEPPPDTRGTNARSR